MGARDRHDQAVPELTASQVNKAGRTLRHAMRGDDVSTEEFDAARRVLVRYRAAHQYPLTTAGMGLRSAVKTEGCSRRGVPAPQADSDDPRQARP
jgi:hypothetical protein